MKNIKGFTLIETLIYLALFGVIVGGISAGVYAIAEGSGRTEAKITLQQEGDFLTAKINWALSGASAIALNPTPQSLKINKFIWPANPLVFSTAGNNITLSEGGAPAQILNSSVVKVSNLFFQDIPGQSTQPEGITASFTLTALASNGFPVSQGFEATEYLWK